MLTDIIIIIPTHKRQHYLNRVAWYYSHFDMKVYICDSTPGTSFNIDKYDNVNYIWCPEKNFYTKILHVLNTTNADFYATSPDDDFLKQETLMECYFAMKNDRSYSMGIGRQVFFKPNHLNDGLYFNTPSNRLNGLILHNPKIVNAIKFWCNYQNILWSIFRKETLLNAFYSLVQKQYNSQNFIELTIGMYAINSGNIYVSEHALNYREVIEGEHWGKEEMVISIENYFKYENMKKDIHKFWMIKENQIVHRIGLISYLIATNKYISLIRYVVESKIFRRSMRDISYKDTEMINLIAKSQTYVKF